MNDRPTISDVAAHAGVSTATVSRVINGQKWVTPEKAEAVRDAIRAVGFVPNRSARSLRTGRSATVGFLLHSSAESLFGDPTFARLFTETSHALASYEDYSLVLLVAGDRESEKRVLRVIERRTLDGIILIPHTVDDPLLEPLVASGIPLVNCGLVEKWEGQVSFVCADDESGGRQAGQRFVERGCERIGIIASPAPANGREPRLDGLVEVVGDRLVPDPIRFGDFTKASGRTACRALLDAHPELDGLFVASDLMAEGALETLNARGLRVPEDVAVIGFDDNTLAATTTPPLTTVRQSFDMLGAELVRLLDHTMREGGAESRVLPVELVVRESA